MDLTMENPFFSIIVAVLNGENTLEKCIESVNNQSFPHKELIIFDGKSTDRTVEILKNSEKKIAYWESKTDRGIYHAFNTAIRHAKGDWIYFLGSDDTFFFRPRCLKISMLTSRNCRHRPSWFTAMLFIAQTMVAESAFPGNFQKEKSIHCVCP